MASPIKDKRSIDGEGELFADTKSPQASQESLHLRGNRRWAGIESQPEYSSISPERLANEVKSIYTDLVTTEAKCIQVDLQRASHPDEPNDSEHWLSDFSLHRSLIQNHYDFLMATQHLLATSAMLELANRYSIPARM